MALSFVASTAWVSSTASVTPGVPSGTAVGDYVVIGLVSKYEDAVLTSVPAGWTDLAIAVNATRSTGADNGGLRGRMFGRVWQTGDTMPALSPTPNNVSTVHATAYRVASGKVFDVSASGCVDDTTGTPLLLTASTTLGLTAGDILHVDQVLNGDVVTWGTGTLTVTGATMSASSTNTADLSTTTGFDLNMRSVRYTVSSGTASAAPSLSTALAGTTTNAVGVGLMLRIREANPYAATQAAFRFYEDGTETASTAIAAQNTNITRGVNSDSNLQLRVRMQETGGGVGGATTDSYQLQYSLNSATYANVGTAPVVGFNSASLTDTAATTNRLGAGTGSFVAGEISETGLASNHQLTASNYTEYLYSLTLGSAALADADTLDFRLLVNGATTGLTYTVTPRITASKPVLFMSPPVLLVPRFQAVQRAAVR